MQTFQVDELTERFEQVVALLADLDVGAQYDPYAGSRDRAERVDGDR